MFRHTMWIKNFAEFALSGMVFKIQAFLCFAIFTKNLKIQNGRHFWRDKNFLKNQDGYSVGIPYGSKISSKSLYLARLSRYKHFLCFEIFAKNSKIQNGRHFLARQNFLRKFRWLLCRDTLWVKKFIELALSCTIFKIQAFLCFAIFAKNLKI